MNIFTTEDLLEFYYQETSPEKSMGILIALKNDWALQQKYDVLCQAANRLDNTLRSPRPEAVKSIMAYASRLTSEPVE